MAAPEGRFPELLVLQGSSFCNIDCRYCYVAGRERRERMSEEVLRAVAQKVVAASGAPDEMEVAWHAGEPMALPAAWVDAACDMLAAHAPPGRRLRFVIQTNATLVDERWIAVIAKHRISIGVSIDGPEEIHDAKRVTRRGAGTFRSTMRGVEALCDAGVPFTAIAVLTRQSLAEPDRMYDFFSSLRPTSLGFNIEEQEGENRTTSLDVPGIEQAYRAFLRRFLERHRATGEPFRLRSLATVRDLARGARLGLRGHGQQIEPFSILTVAADGGLSTFSPELIGTPAPDYADFVFGNILTGGIEAMRRDAALQRAAAQIAAGVRACRKSCAYFDVCGGGAPSNKFFENGSLASTETLHCRLVTMETVDAVLDSLELQDG
ncbi:cyclophane-forming radical SAM/SPASM peptide maturase GrrM/OscB [Acuticoccus kandeliae]|uniref:cyclophane-forming radical SAM/SPASM peptide maturase GrrM/OscB n=1 Tax=Acuticoccus kandeliae TaxID=2073160 RepID=UPI000D3E05C4|nr:cyclophane-forming radical SAM/SPASM peptide maturase GrrM/OscB [Acuticoccus kandeliae]